MTMRPSLQSVLLIVVVALWLVGASSAPAYDTYLFRVTASWAVAAVGVQLLLRTTGDLCFGHGVFVGVGAYTYALCGGATSSWGIALSVAAGGFATVLASAAVYGLLWRVTGVYFTLATVCVSETFRIGVSSAYETLGGDNGIHGIPRPPWIADGVGGIAVIGLVLTAALVLSARVGNTRLGRAGHAVRQSPHRVESLGRDPSHIRFALRIVSAIPSGVAGVLLASLDGGCHPQLFGWLTSGELITLALLCGPRVVAGPACAAALLIWSRSWLAGISDHWPLVIGAVLVAISRGLSWRLPRARSSQPEETHAPG